MAWLTISATAAVNLARAVFLRVTDVEVAGRVIDADGRLATIHSRDASGVATARNLVASGAWFEFAANSYVNLDLISRYGRAGAEAQLIYGHGANAEVVAKILAPEMIAHLENALRQAP